MKVGQVYRAAIPFVKRRIKTEFPKWDESRLCLASDIAFNGIVNVVRFNRAGFSSPGSTAWSIYDLMFNEGALDYELMSRGAPWVKLGNRQREFITLDAIAREEIEGYEEIAEERVPTYDQDPHFYDIPAARFISYPY